jgi:hypothetical protein
VSALEEILIAELAAASAHLLEKGLAPASARESDLVVGPATIAAGDAARLAGLVKHALLELATTPSSTNETLEIQRVPRRARASRRACDHALHGASVVPIAFLALEPTLEAPRAPLEWLLSLIDGVDDELERHVALYDESLDEAVRFRSGSDYGVLDVAQLEDNHRRLVAARALLRATRRLVRDASSFGLVARPQRPRPFPRSRTFEALAHLEEKRSDPRRAGRALASDLFGQRGRGIDVAYLYQRWCGVKLVAALAALGYEAQSDPVPALLLSGAVEFRSPTGIATLVSEPRLVAGKPPVEGLFVHHGESSPDFVLLVHTGEGRRAHVLDPTLRHLDDARREKARYLEIVKVEGSRRIAGVGVQPGVDTSWAAAPLDHTNCLPVDWRGEHGTVPMNPLRFDSRPLERWLSFVLGRR